MYRDGQLIIAKCEDKDIAIIPKLANRHGLIAGATGTGKTVTLRQMAQTFSDAGVPVFLADVKGDLASLAKINPVNFWDLYGQMGLPLRTTISEMGPVLLARLMELTKLQEDILNIVFKIADEEGLLLIDTKDLRSMLMYVGDNTEKYSQQYGNMSKQSLNVIMRGVVSLEEAGGDIFFGEPAINIKDWFRTDCNGKGMINIMHSSSLINSPKLYSTFMLWLLSEIFEVLPEAGDLEKPKMVFFFDEAHLLFNSAPKALLEKIEQVVKLIRSKGVGVYFCTQNPKDIPDGVLGQLGNKVQHALHAYTPNDQKAIKVAADSFRPNPAFNTKDVIEQLGIGEALISFLQADGSPSVVERAKVYMPEGVLGAISDEERKNYINSSEFFFKYQDSVDRDSAYEFLMRKKESDAKAAEEAAEEARRQKEEEKARIEEEKLRQKEEAAALKAEQKAEADALKAEQKAEAAALKAEQAKAEKAAKARTTVIKNTAKSAGGTIGREVGNAIGKSVGGTFGKKLGGNIGASLGRGILGNLFGK